jgi:selenocysteine-specific elongation factor
MHVLSTAGHVDHGKSALVTRLTGIDPDRLQEEKARGLTIDLGFAWLTLPSGREAGIVDVPGHERFVHNMLAGVGSVDSAIFVVAANEGWMPQSEEHLEILDLLGARRAVIALTKRDLVDAGALEAAGALVRARLHGTTLQDAEIVPVSATTGEGCDELLAAVDRMLDEEPVDGGRARLFVDRSFTVKGAGTVVTGTLTGGRLRVDDEVFVMPAGRRARIRSIQSHRTKRDEAAPISRVALNLAGLDRTLVRRGDAIVTDGWKPATTLDVSLRSVRSLAHALTARGKFKAYIGAAEADARVTLYERASLKRGKEGFARVMLGAAVVTTPGDRFVLRDVSRDTTAAGGVVLDAHPPTARGPARAHRVTQLAARAEALARAAATGHETFADVVVSERGVVARADIPWLAGTSNPPRDAVALQSYWVSRARLDEIAETLEEALRAFHAREPLATGMPREEARAAAHIDDARLYAELLDALRARVATEGALVRLATHEVALDPRRQAARAALLDALAAEAFRPPSFAALQEQHGAVLLRALLDDGTLVKVADDIVFAAAQIEQAKDIIAKTFETEGPLTAARIKEVLGTSRKYAIPLVEHLDRTGFTKRDGDLRSPRAPRA